MEGNHTSSPCSLQGLVPAPLLTHWDLIGFSVCPPYKLLQGVCAGPGWAMGSLGA